MPPGRKMSIARSHMQRAIGKSMSMTREQDVKRAVIAGNAADGVQQHGSHKVRLSSVDDKEAGSHIIYIPSAKVEMKSIVEQAQEAFGYEREAFIYIPKHFYDDDTILSTEPILDLINQARKRPDGNHKITTDDEVARVVAVWEQNASRRRKKVVDDLMIRAFKKIRTGKPAEKLLGLDMVFELTSVPANLSSMNEEDLDILSSVVNDTNQYLSVRNKAALVCWQLENILHGRFGAALVKRGTHLKVIDTLRDALSRLDDEGSVETSQDSAHGDDAAFEDPAEKYVTCTKTELGGVYPLAGALVSMIEIASVKVLMARPENLQLLLSIAAQPDPLAAKCGADGVAIMLASKWAARVELVRGAGLLRLEENLASSATEVNLSSAASINCIVRDSNGRRLVPPEHAAQCFLGLLNLSQWCREELDRTAKLDKKGEQYRTFGRNEKLVPMMLEHTAAAIWGCAACISDSKQFHLLEETVPKWVPQLQLLCQFNSASVEPSVMNGANAAMALLTAGLADTISYHFEDAIYEYLEIVEGGKQEDAVIFEITFEGNPAPLSASPRKTKSDAAKRREIASFTSKIETVLNPKVENGFEPEVKPEPITFDDAFRRGIATALRIEEERVAAPQLSTTTVVTTSVLSGGKVSQDNTVAAVRIKITKEDRKDSPFFADEMAAKIQALATAAEEAAAAATQAEADKLKSKISGAVAEGVEEEEEEAEGTGGGGPGDEPAAGDANESVPVMLLDASVFGKFTVAAIEAIPHEPVPLSAREAAAATLCAMSMAGSGTLDRYRGQLDEAMRDKGSAIVDGIIAKDGIEKCARIIEESMEMEASVLLEKQLAATMMYLCGIPGRRSRELLTAVVKLLSSTNRQVVHFMTMTIWLLAHDEHNRIILGDLWAIDGLMTVCKANSDIRLKEYILSALWMLATPTSDGTSKNAVRLAMRGGLQYVVAMVNFDFDESGQYVKLVTLGVGLLFEMASHNEDIQILIEQMSIGDALIRAIFHPLSSPYLKVLAAGLIFKLTRRSDVLLKELKEIRGRWVLEDIYSSMLCCEHGELQVIGLFCVTALSMDVPSKVAFGKRNCVQGIVSVMKDSQVPEEIFVKCLHALLNLSTHTSNQSDVCRRTLKLLLRITNNPRSQREMEFATSILANLSNNVVCRKLMYKFQLKHTSTALARTQPLDFGLEEAGATTAWQMEQLEEFEKGTRGEFLGWFMSNFVPNDDEYAADDFEALPFDADDETIFSSLGEGTAFDNQRTFTPGKVRPSSSPMSGRFGSRGMSRPGSKAGGSVSRPGSKAGSVVGGSRISHTSAYDREISNEQLSTIQRWIRTPVQALWEDNLLAQQLTPSTPGLGERSVASSKGTRRSRLQARAGASTSPEKSFRPLSPKRSSHRIGPVGALGSSTTWNGQNRWEPRVMSYRQPYIEVPENDDRAQARPKTGQRPPTSHTDKDGNLVAVGDLTRIRQVQLEPSTGYNKITFGGEKKISHYAPVQMCKWKRVPGATVYSDLFRFFEGSNGEQCYFYHNSDIVCEALDPGPYPDPQPPLFMEQILQTDMPPPPSLLKPDGNSQYPSVFFPDIPKCPSICKHAVPSCMLAGFFGGVSADPVPLLVRQAPPVVVGEVVAPRSPDAPKWDPNESVFKERKQEADSKQLTDRANNNNVKSMALNRDWKRLANESRFHKFVFKNDNDVKDGEASIDEELKETREVFKTHYGHILWIFDYYCAIGTTFGRSAHSIQMNSFAKFIQDCKIPDENVSVEDCTKIFIVVNYEEDKKSYQSEVNEDKALMRHELCEALVRIAVQKYSKVNPDVSDCLELLMNHIIENIPKEAIIDPDDFRDDRFYSEAMEMALKKYLGDLKKVYTHYSLLNPVQGKAQFGIAEVVQLLKDAGMLGNAISSREARLAFFQSRMVVKDEVNSRLKFMTLSWWEFIEVMARLADCMSLPTDENVAELAAESLIDFELKLKACDSEKQKRLKERRGSAGMTTLKTRPLDEKMVKFINYLMGRLGVYYQGNLKGKLPFRPKYLNDEQMKKADPQGSLAAAV